MSSYEVPTIMHPKRRCYFTPVLWQRQPPDIERHTPEWDVLRERFASVRQGEFDALDDLPRLYSGLDAADAQLFAVSLLGDAGTDAQLEWVEQYVLTEIREITRVAELCHALGLWGRLSCIDAILRAYDWGYPGQFAEGLPIYFTTMLENEYGPAADYPRDESVETWQVYETGLRALQQQRLEELGGPRAYAFFGGPFSVRRIAERFLELLGSSTYEKTMRPYLRQRFEACTGIDCSDFYKDGDFQPLTTAAKLEAWLHSDAPDQFEPGERYFWGHKIPR